MGGRFGINCPCTFLKILKNHDVDSSPKLPEPNMWLVVNHTKSTNTLYWTKYLLTAGNYKSASGQLQNNSFNGDDNQTCDYTLNLNPVKVSR